MFSVNSIMHALVADEHRHAQGLRASLLICSTGMTEGILQDERFGFVG